MSLAARIEALSLSVPAANDADRAELERVRARLREPLRVAIAGRVKAGKSTLLNALVGQCVAASDAGECTRIVTWYRDGITYDVKATLNDGATQPLPFRRDDGRLEIGLGPLRPEDIRRIEVVWPSARLATMTLIDTPGLGGFDTHAAGRTRELLGLSEDEGGEVDAVIYLMRHLHGSDGEFLESFRDRSVARPTPVNAVAVLSRADEIGSARPDALVAAARVAERYQRDPRVRALCAAVIPVAGLLAEAGATLRESEAAALRAIAALPKEEQEAAVLSADRFTSRDVPGVPADTRRALLRRLGLFAVRSSIAELREGRARTAQDLATSLITASGIRRLVGTIDEQFARRAELLKARTALASLKRLTRGRPGHDTATHAARSELERLEASATELLPLRIMELVFSDTIELSEDERSEILRVTVSGEPAVRLGIAEGDFETVQRIAHERIAYWRQRGSDPIARGPLRETAEAVAHTYEALIAEAGTKIRRP